MSKTSKRLRFLAEHSEYVSIERTPTGFKVMLGGDEWEGVAEECFDASPAKAIREAVRMVERADIERSKKARRLR